MADAILQTADRALEILEMLGKEGLTATDIQNKMGLNKSTVHRLMMTLKNRGFVERNEQTGIYQIGLKLVEVSSIRLNHIELKTEASPYIHQLANRVDQSVQLAIYDEGEAVFIEKIEKYQSMHMYCQIGKRIPIYCSAVGKTLMMDKRDDEIMTILSQAKYEKYTDNTHETPEEVYRDIVEGRRVGYTKDMAEHEAGVYCISMPIYDYRSKIVAALSITGFDKDIYYEAGLFKREQLALTCLEISRRLGYRES